MDWRGQFEQTDMNSAVPSLLAFAATALVIELTPGPNMGYLAVLSAREGRRAGFAATVGIASGLLIIGLAAALGLTAIIATSRWLYEALRWAGVLYLLWLAWEGWRGDADIARLRQNDPSASDSRFFVRGFVTNLLNPKAGLFYIATLPTFVHTDEQAIHQVVILTCVYVAIATLVHSGIVLLAGAARPWLENQRRRTIIQRALALLLAAIAGWLFFNTKYVR
jgi:threonine/homoserine/homoserine lactone efflux protein